MHRKRTILLIRLEILQQIQSGGKWNLRNSTSGKGSNWISMRSYEIFATNFTPMLKIPSNKFRATICSKLFVNLSSEKLILSSPSLLTISDIEAVLVELRPFSRHFLPVLQEVRQLPNCSDIYIIFNNIITSCGKEAISFGKQAYKEYDSIKTEVEAFLELLPEEWKSLSLQQCISGGTCLSNSFKKQAQSVSNKMQKLKKKFHDFNFDDKLESCKESVEEVSRIIESIKNISRLVKEFSFQEEIVKIKDLSRRITGKHFGDDDGSQVSFHTVSFT